jgi:protein-L-isoaspartate(D-aspartate) O-methyltransferase
LPHKEQKDLEGPMDFAEARARMVEGQVRPSDITDLRIIAAMLELRREDFVYPDQAELAYADLDLALRRQPGAASSRCLMRARTLAKLIQTADISPQDMVLDVGCTTGYGAAVMAYLAGEVVALEEDPDLAAFARKSISQCGIGNAAVVTGPLTAGWPAKAPYDVIVLEGGTEVVPRALFGQLRDGGRLVCIEGRGPAAKAMLYRSAAGGVSGRSVFDAAAPLLPGFAEPPAFVF